MLRVRASGVVEAHGAYTGRKPALSEAQAHPAARPRRAGRDDLAALRFLTKPIRFCLQPGPRPPANHLPFTQGVPL